MDLTQKFYESAAKKPMKIVYPEGEDERIIEVAVRSKKTGICEPILVGNEESIEKISSEKALDLSGVTIVSCSNQDLVEKYAKSYSASRGVKEGIARKLVKKPLSFSGMMVKEGDADGMVGGVASATASVIQAASLTIGFLEGMSTPSSFFIMMTPDFMGEKNKLFIFADCAVNIQPSPDQLADIAIASGKNAKALLGIEPMVAILSFSTKGSASHADVDKVKKALEKAKGMNPGFEIDGELQADSAIVPKVAAKKVKESSVAGKANVLVFPDLDSGNMAYKLVQYLGNAKAIGPVLQGFAKPVNDLSRGASIEDILAVTAITVVQAQSN